MNASCAAPFGRTKQGTAAMKMMNYSHRNRFISLRQVQVNKKQQGDAHANEWKCTCAIWLPLRLFYINGNETICMQTRRTPRLCSVCGTLHNATIFPSKGATAHNSIWPPERLETFMLHDAYRSLMLTACKQLCGAGTIMCPAICERVS